MNKARLEMQEKILDLHNTCVGMAACMLGVSKVLKKWSEDNTDKMSNMEFVGRGVALVEPIKTVVAGIEGFERSATSLMSTLDRYSGDLNWMSATENFEQYESMCSTLAGFMGCYNDDDDYDDDAEDDDDDEYNL